MGNVLFVPSKTGVFVTLSLVEVLQSNPTGLQVQIPWGFPVPLSEPQAGKPDVGFRNFTPVGELLWYYCSPVCAVTHPEGMGFDCLMIVPRLPSLCGFFVFGCRESFFDGFQCSADGCSTASCNLGALAGGDERVSL